MAEETQESSEGEKDFSLINDILVEGIFKGTIGSSSSYYLTDKGNKVMADFLNIFDKADLETVIQKVLIEGKESPTISQDNFLQTFVMLMNKDGFAGYKFYDILHQPHNLKRMVDIVKRYNIRVKLFFCHLAIIAKETGKRPEYNLLYQDEEILRYIPSKNEP